MLVRPTGRIDTEDYLRKCVQAAIDHDTIKYFHQVEYFVNMCDLPEPAMAVSKVLRELGVPDAGHVV